MAVESAGLGPRLAAIDALRGVAFLAVFLFHAFLEMNSGAGGWLAAVYSGPWNYFFPNHFGVFGVQLFFVVSGFCIHRSVLTWQAAHPDASAARLFAAYAGRRVRRIYPPYLVVLIALWGIAAGTASGDLAALGFHAAFLHTLVPGQVNLINPSFWSLAVEVQLYALYPLLWLALRRWGAVPAIGLGALGCLAWKLGVPGHGWLAALPWRWGFEWLLGVGVAATLASPRWPSAGQVFGLGVAAVVLLAPSRSAVLYAAVPPLLFAILLGWAVRCRPRPWPWLAGVGGVSYSLYLVHQPVLRAAAAAAASWGWPTVEAAPFVLLSVAALAASFLLALPLERLTARRRLEEANALWADTSAQSLNRRTISP